ncbi:hypothetical protein [Chitinophaga sp. HK235]|uniref:hypothetical protein n=1 Tax=Chitinophaga sp. HK235 TaxID=2952571 RepID=UPI001BA9A968|nr:hypothetical protein [Chitinophaga sp. HK235]
MEKVAYATGQKFEQGVTHGVEFDLLLELDTSENTKVGTNLKAGFYCEDDRTVIVALVESIEEDDAMWLRIVTDCIIEAYGVDDTIKTGDRLEIRMPKDKFKMTCIGTLFK